MHSLRTCDEQPSVTGQQGFAESGRLGETVVAALCKPVIISESKESVSFTVAMQPTLCVVGAQPEVTQ